MPIKGTIFCSYTICYIVTKWKNYALYCDLCICFSLYIGMLNKGLLTRVSLFPSVHSLWYN